jgi:hypothetical protein
MLVPTACSVAIMVWVDSHWGEAASGFGVRLPVVLGAFLLFALPVQLLARAWSPPVGAPPYSTVPMWKHILVSGLLGQGVYFGLFMCLADAPLQAFDVGRFLFTGLFFGISMGAFSYGNLVEQDRKALEKLLLQRDLDAEDRGSPDPA